ncbi:MAG: hypothetical protein ACTHK7_15665 [Aureliella sp.]
MTIGNAAASLRHAKHVALSEHVFSMIGLSSARSVCQQRGGHGISMRGLIGMLEHGAA